MPRLSSGNICKCGGFAYVWIDISITPLKQNNPGRLISLMAYYLQVLISVSAITKMSAMPA